MKKLTLTALSVLLISQLCIAQLKVKELNPEPNLNMPTTDLSLGLSLDESIISEFLIPKQNGIKKGKVEAWRRSLENGFNNGFGDFFNVTPTDSELDGILSISKAELEFVPAAVNGYGIAVAVNSQIKYRAEWKDNKGEVLKRMAGTAESKSAATNPKQITMNVENVVETMYEQIASQMGN